MPDQPTWSEVDQDHPMTQMMNGLVDGHRQLCASAKISPWDFCVMLANVQGLILAQSKDAPTSHLLGRANDLRSVVRHRVREERAPPKPTSVN
jgi:hypothetical protein